MALIVETGSGSSTSDSYISLADANTYIASHGNSTTWSAATDASKEEALRIATQYIDLKYEDRFVGIKASRDNALCWPRIGVIDADGYSYNSNEIPLRLTYAVAEAALRHIAGDDLLGVITDNGTIKSETSILGPIEDTVEYIGGKSQTPAYPKIMALLRPIVGSLDIVSRG